MRIAFGWDGMWKLFDAEDRDNYYDRIRRLRDENLIEECFQKVIKQIQDDDDELPKIPRSRTNVCSLAKPTSIEFLENEFVTVDLNDVPEATIEPQKTSVFGHLVNKCVGYLKKLAFTTSVEQKSQILTEDSVYVLLA
jgi:hypothetical protein